MNFGTRQIRTSGKGSGSIELTLPNDLRDLVGLPCRITLRDGSRPEIVLQPNLDRAIAGFTKVWQMMVASLLPEQAERTLPLGAFALGLQPGVAGNDRPYLCWRDGLALASAPPHDPQVVARTLAAFGHVLATPCAVAPSLTRDFGVACARLATGAMPATGLEEICDVVAGALPAALRHAAAIAVLADSQGEGAADPGFWKAAAGSLSACADLFLHWTAHPAELASLRQAWQRGFAVEMNRG